MKDEKEKGFTSLKQLTPQKIVWHLRHNKVVFLVCKNLENGKYMIVSYRLKIINGRECLAIWGAYHEHQNTPTITVLIHNEAFDYNEWKEMLEKGVGKTGILGIDCTLTDYFKIDVFNGGEHAFPRNPEFYACSSDRAEEFGNGIEEEFAEYWFKQRKFKDDLSAKF